MGQKQIGRMVVSDEMLDGHARLMAQHGRGLNQPPHRDHTRPDRRGFRDCPILPMGPMQPGGMKLRAGMWYKGRQLTARDIHEMGAGFKHPPWVPMPQGEAAALWAPPPGQAGGYGAGGGNVHGGYGTGRGGGHPVLGSVHGSVHGGGRGGGYAGHGSVHGSAHGGGRGGGYAGHGSAHGGHGGGRGRGGGGHGGGHGPGHHGGGHGGAGRGGHHGGHPLDPYAEED
ncbi:MAG: hypothetical protein Q9220_001740 [cf. Caloplaca sp. 1 TL-2023]